MPVTTTTITIAVDRAALRAEYHALRKRIRLLQNHWRMTGDRPSGDDLMLMARQLNAMIDYRDILKLRIDKPGEEDHEQTETTV